MLYPSCSEWVGKLKGEEYAYIGESNSDIYNVIALVKEGHHINDFEWDNNGGGAHSSFLENMFKVAEFVVGMGLNENEEAVNIALKNISNLDGQEMEDLLSVVKDGKILPKHHGFVLDLVDHNKEIGKILIGLSIVSGKFADEIKEKIFVGEI